LVLGLSVPSLIQGASSLHGLRVSVQCPLHTLGELVAAGVGGDIVGGAGLFIVVGDDAAQKLGGVAATAAARYVYSRRGFGVFVIALAGRPLLHIRLIRLAAAGHGTVEQRDHW
jgi:hypothetical protein